MKEEEMLMSKVDGESVAFFMRVCEINSDFT